MRFESATEPLMGDTATQTHNNRDMTTGNTYSNTFKMNESAAQE